MFQKKRNALEKEKEKNACQNKHSNANVYTQFEINSNKFNLAYYNSSNKKNRNIKHKL